MIAYCWASGRIGFGRTTPNGALPIASGRPQTVKRLFEVVARHGYEEGVLLVPGVPEAGSQSSGLAALERFIDWLGKRQDKGVTVFTRAHRWPIAGKRKLVHRRQRHTLPLDEAA